MEIFIDTARIDEIKQAMDWGVCDGVTTNPSWIARDGAGKKTFKQVVMEICEVVPGPVSAEAVSLSAEGMVKEAEEIASWAKNIVVKIPLTEEGIKATKILTEKGIKTNLTLVHSANQAILAAKVGATYVSPFMGRFFDSGMDGLQLVEDIIEIYRIQGFKTKVLAASYRTPFEISEAAKMGVDVVTIKFEYLKKMFHHPYTDAGLKTFLEDWKKVPK
ncbi:fructose-6-phosphate aldolase [archaeon]|nr:fructose-6-phosphate aldolase [archaeon]